VYYIHYDMSHNKHERENCHFYVAHPMRKAQVVAARA
jgi:hypothetical protein